MIRGSGTLCAATIAALVAGLCVAPRTARAEHERTWEAGIYAGGNIVNHNDSPLGTPGVEWPRNSAVVGARLGWEFVKRLSLEAEFDVTPTTAANTSSGNVFILGYRGQLLYRFLDGMVEPFLLVGFGGMTVESSAPNIPDNHTLGAMHVGAGFKFPIDEGWGVRLDGRVHFPGGFDDVSPTYAILATVYKQWGTKPAPAPIKVVVDPDRDKDGIPNEQDKCPDEKGPKENAGCPDKDTDGDGLIDRLDKCPTEAGPKETGGCPDKDTDGDGIVDRLDKCPKEAGPRENDGCPDTDQDKDGVVDRLDKCPTEAGPAENNGCPLPQAVKQFTGKIEGIFFAVNSAKIQPKSFTVLDKVVAVLKEYPTLPLTIEGHTSAEGKREKNMKLSQDRADAVKAYFVSKGIDAARLTSIGIGPDRPIADNKKPKGREQNRRIEFQIKAGAAK